SYDWSKYDFAHVLYQPAKMSPQELQEGYNLVFRKFYSWPRIFRRTLRNWRYLHYFLPASLYYSWVSHHPKTVPLV
ncbi:MAG: B12-binding domain-containing radical SAM protein, partial [Candidatus Caldatribacteriaceae bacterium]